jgi:hypothetical protein
VKKAMQTAKDSAAGPEEIDYQLNRHLPPRRGAGVRLEILIGEANVNKHHLVSIFLT